MKFKTFTVAAALALTTAAASAAPVQINETLLGLGTQVVNNVARLNGGYSEVITITAPVSPNPLPTFGAAGFASFGQYYDSSNNAITFSGGQTTLGFTYNLFAVFNATGVVSNSSTLTGLAGSFTLYAITGGVATAALDPLNGYTPAGFNTTVGSTVYTLATSTHLSTGVANGIGSPSSSFQFVFDNLTLTSAGQNFFTNPNNPFFASANVNGDVNNGLPNTAIGTHTLAGDVSVEFDDNPNTVPEPGTLALVGLALAGLGLGRRRSNSATK